MGILYEGQLLRKETSTGCWPPRNGSLRRSATARAGRRVSDGIIWQRIQGREWLATVRDFSPEKLRMVQSLVAVEHVEVLDVDLEGTVQGLRERPKGGKMNWLLWKEYRQNRVVVWATLVVLVLPHLIALYAACTEAGQKRYEIVGASSQRLPAWPCFERDLAVSSFYGLVSRRSRWADRRKRHCRRTRRPFGGNFRPICPSRVPKLWPPNWPCRRRSPRSSGCPICLLSSFYGLLPIRAISRPARRQRMVAMVLINTAITGSASLPSPGSFRRFFAARRFPSAQDW